MTAEEKQRTLKFLFHCTFDGSKEKHEIIYQDAITISEVKEYIEEKYQIPMLCQKLYFDSTPLRDEDTLTQSWIREDDIITVEFNTGADVNEINEMVRILKKLLNALRRYYDTFSLMHFSIISEADIKRIYDLTGTVFEDESKRSGVNRLLFVQKGGIKPLFDLYHSALQFDYHLTIFRIRYLECVLTFIIGRILIYPCTMVPVLKQSVLENPTLEYVCRSFTRVLIPYRGRIVAPRPPNSWSPGTRFVSQLENDRVLKLTLQRSHVNLSNLAELPELHIQFASNNEVIQQMFSRALSLGSRFRSSYTAIGTLEFLSKHSTDGHVYLSSSTILNNVLSVYRHQLRRGYKSQTEFRLDTMILKSLIVSFFSELISHSADIIPLPFKGKIYYFLENFLESADHMKVRKFLEQDGYINTNILPTLSLPFVPLRPHNPQYSPQHNSMIRKLRDLCVEFGVFAIQCELLGEYERTYVVQHGLLDFVLCLLWVVPHGTTAHSRARAIVSYLSEKMTLQPPSLINMARAKLAKMYFGLKRTLTLSLHELVQEYHNINAIDTTIDTAEMDHLD